MENGKDMNLEEYVDQHRWLLNNGLVNDNVKNQLFFCGSIVHREVQAVEVDINPDKRIVLYKIYVDKNLLKKIEKYRVLSKSTGLFDMWRFKRLLQKEGSLDFQKVLGKFVHDFCGPKWSVSVETVDFSVYIDELGEHSGADGQSQQPDKLPD
jgi:hypothetical protein